MTEQHMPARIWVRSCGGGVSLPSGATYVTVVGENRDVGRGVAFVRADIAEHLAEAMSQLLDYAINLEVNIECDGGSVDDTENVMDAARSALSAFKAGQSEASHDH